MLETLRRELALLDYRGVFWPKSRAKTMAEKEARLVDGCATFYKGAFPSIASVTSLLDSFKTHSIQGIIRPSKNAQHHKLYEEHPRRDNINEKVQELAHFVPMHRLEDEKVRKHILNNPPLFPFSLYPNSA